MLPLRVHKYLKSTVFFFGRQILSNESWEVVNKFCYLGDMISVLWCRRKHCSWKKLSQVLSSYDNLNNDLSSTLKKTYNYSVDVSKSRFYIQTVKSMELMASNQNQLTFGSIL